MKDMVLLIYLVNAVVTLFLYIAFFRRTDDSSGIMRLLISLAVPPVGCIWALLFQCAPENMSETNCRKIRQQSYMELDGGREDRMVPMSEALVMNDHLVCCSMLIGAMKDDSIKYAASIREALRIGDAETAHYAAAAVTQMRRTLMEKVNRLEAQYLAETYDLEIWEEYASALEACLDSELFDDAAEMRMLRSLEEILGRILIRRPTPKAFARMIDLHINRDNIRKAMYYSKKFLKCCPNEEKAYLLHIECMIRKNDDQGLRDFLAALPKYPVKLTHATLQYIRGCISAGFAGNSIEV